jgi:2-amino-4-hydroxy-6-hydroxymethyldihydropteridine diphosphokinase
MPEVFVALGSNLGDRAANMAAAREALARGPLNNPVASSIYETDPWGPIRQGRYLNQVVRGTTELAPRALLRKLQGIELSLGRDRAHEARYGPRTIDLDILLYDEIEMKEVELTIPHPRMTERPFVLVPLSEIAPDLEIAGVPISQLLAQLDLSGVAISQQTA